MEILNVNELSELAAAAPYEEGHVGLLVAFRNRYPEIEFLLVGVSGEWSSLERGLVDAAGNRIADKFSTWA